jgi:hypothetical protein
MPAAEAPNYTPTQGQYLAFIYAYTCVLGRPPAQAVCSASSVSRHLQFIR